MALPVSISAGIGFRQHSMPCHRHPFIHGLASLLLVFSLVVAVGGRCRAATVSADDKVTITSASYGTGTRTANVTTRVAELISAPGDSFIVDRIILGKDPAVGVAKELHLGYRFRGVKGSYKVLDGKKLSYEDLVFNITGNKVAPPDEQVPAPAGPASVADGPDEQILTDQQMGGLVLIEGEKEVAMGFVAKIHDTDCIVTNLHVLCANPKFVVRNLAGGEVAVRGMIGAIGADVGLLRIVNSTGLPVNLVLADKVMEAAKIGDPVVIMAIGRGAVRRRRPAAGSADLGRRASRWRPPFSRAIMAAPFSTPPANKLSVWLAVQRA